MRYFKIVNDGYIICVGKGSMGTEITQTEYNNIINAISAKQTVDGFTYRLKEDLSWDEFAAVDYLLYSNNNS